MILWVVMIVVALLSANVFISGILIIYTGLLPFINATLWLSLSETGKKIRESLKVWHWAVMSSWLIFVYSLYAQKWTAGVINEIFHVDAESFGITYGLLAFLFTPVGLLYQQSVIGAAFTIFFVGAMILVTLIPFALITDIPFKKIAKSSALFFLCVFLMSFFLTTASNISRHLNDVTMRFAIWADFNEHHLCTNPWSTRSKGVIFLGGNKVLVYFPRNEKGSQFKVESCDLQESF